MICPSCQTENIEGADVCANCGQALTELDLPGAAKYPQPPAFVNQPLTALPKHEPARVGADDPVALAVHWMQNLETNAVLVMDGSRLKGIITGWDILHKVAGPNEDLNAVTCRQVMTADPLCLHEDDSIGLALNLMASGGFRHVPVLAGDTPANVIGVGDVFRYLSPHLV
jgi:CBS domain-containing protein